MPLPVLLRLLLALLLGFSPFRLAAAADPGPPLSLHPAADRPDWVRHAIIYEINVRQYSADHSFAAIEADLPRLRSLGVNVLWFMPIQPIGETNRKGPLGSYYSIRDYLAINPEFGDATSFKSLVTAARAAGFRVILDWVANHTAWDNPLTTTHPEFYATNAAGSFVPPFGFDWTDVIQLDYTHRPLWDYMVEAMSYWVREYHLDGFRCDYAKGLPTPAWESISAQLLARHPGLFLLAEAEEPGHQQAAFHASYGWDLLHTFEKIAQGKQAAPALDSTLARLQVRFPRSSSFLLCTSNHDENSWQGTVFERLGGGHRVFALLSYTLDGIPLLYNGQEAGLDRRLKFFEHDPIEWRPHPLFAFYQTLHRLKRDHPALATGAPFTRIPTSENEKVYAFSRGTGPAQVLILANLTPENLTQILAVSPELDGSYRDVFSGLSLTLQGWHRFDLPAWHFLLLTRQP